jgi:signal-transduction protein with cAMP-binding, CBS, and nucleotidyltransferase domain
MDSSARDILNKKGWQVHTIEPQATVFEAIDKMVDLNIGALVVTGDDGSLEGMITERDYLTKVALKGRSSRSTTVAEIMTSDLVVIETGYTVRHCLWLMTEHRCRHLPVVKDGAVIGLVSTGDCAREIASDRQITVQYFVDFIARRYPN